MIKTFNRDKQKVAFNINQPVTFISAFGTNQATLTKKKIVFGLYYLASFSCQLSHLAAKFSLISVPIHPQLCRSARCAILHHPWQSAKVILHKKSQKDLLMVNSQVMVLVCLWYYCSGKQGTAVMLMVAFVRLSLKLEGKHYWDLLVQLESMHKLQFHLCQ